MLIETGGFECEIHQIETEDGYKIKVHRIKPKYPSLVPRLGPIFLMHGLFATAADYVMTGGDNALAFLLSRNGYDVWLGNARGTDHGLRHKTLKSSDKEFWDFSWHEIGLYDLPAMIDYMLKETKSSKTFFVGHSQGTTSLLVLLSTRPEYNQKIIQAHLMAPAAFMKNWPKSTAKSLASDVQVNQISCEIISFHFKIIF
jgi:lysosomal acid lipase/cholesteryl ester hydrolase